MRNPIRLLCQVLSRFAEWLGRVAMTAAALGVRNAWTIHVLARFGVGELTLALPGGRRFRFRRRKDRGVVSHFYTRGYRLRDTPTRPIRTIVDAGANIGDETLRFAVHHPTAAIVAVEAEPENARLLQANTANIPTIQVIVGGLWPTSGWLEVSAPPGASPESFRVVPVPESGPGRIEAWSIPRLLAHTGWSEIDVLKLDIEGAELMLFSSGAATWIDRVNTIIIEVADHEQPGTLQALFAAIASIPFDGHLCGENLVLIRRETGWQLDRVIGIEWGT